jgi:hypothetical protein
LGFTVEVLAIVSIPRSLNPTGEVKDGFVILRGQTVRAKLAIESVP